MINLEVQDIQRIAEIVREETGNQVQDKNFAMIEARMRTYLDRSKHQTMALYWKHFQQHEREERDVIAGLMTTHYTFFFREYLQFELLEAWLRTEGPRLQQRHKENGKALQVWSAACSRGHEVYSLGMFLELHLAPLGIPFQILGTDIDQESVAYATNGVYPIKEVNAIPNHYLAKHLRKGTGANKDFAAIDPELRKRVRFRTANLMALPSDILENSFDIIFCRNVFIYFSEDKVQKIASELAKKLMPEGLFFSGISEPLRFSGWNLSNFGPSVYEKGPKKITDIANASLKPVAQTPRPVLAESKPETYKVLVVDDSPTIQKLMTKIFQSDPACSGVGIAGNGAEAKQQLAKGGYNLITLDIHMPVVNGIEFLQNHYRPETDPPVIMVSSVNRSDLDLATKAMSLGAFDYVEKPSMNQIAKSTNEILAKAKLAVKAGKVPKLSVVTSPAATTEKKIQFDLQIGKKVVVPDASKCLRVVAWKPGPLTDLEQLVRGQKDEYRSPALVILAPSISDFVSIKEKLAQWSDRELTVVDKFEETFLRPNRIYFSTPEIIQPTIRGGHIKQISLQILNPEMDGLRDLANVTAVQVLITEALKDHRRAVESALGRPVSDMTPATSFASLSVEYFAMLRAAAS